MEYTAFQILWPDVEYTGFFHIPGNPGMQYHNVSNTFFLSDNSLSRI